MELEEPPGKNSDPSFNLNQPEETRSSPKLDVEVPEAIDILKKALHIPRILEITNIIKKNNVGSKFQFNSSSKLDIARESKKYDNVKLETLRFTSDRLNQLGSLIDLDDTTTPQVYCAKIRNKLFRHS